MKRIVLVVFIASFFSSVKAQLTGTKWANKMFVPTLENIIINFKTDTAELQLAETGEPIEYMAYKVKSDTLFLKKTFGGSPCDDNVAFTLKYEISGNQLKLSNLMDPCEIRSKGWPQSPWIKTKN